MHTSRKDEKARDQQQYAETGMTAKETNDEAFSFLKKAISAEEQKLQDDWARREELVDQAWYENEEAGVQDEVGGDLFASYENQEVEQ